MSVIATGPSNGLFVKDLDDTIGIGATINAAGQFVASTGPEIRRVTANPNGLITDFGGSLALDVTNGVVYINTSTANVAGPSWRVVATGAGASSSSVTKLFALTTPAVDFANNTTGEQTFVAGQVSVPANTYLAGSTLRFRVAANLNQAGAGTIRIRFYAQDGRATTLADTGVLNFANNNSLVVDATATVRATGTTAATVGSLNGFVAATGFASQTPNGANLNTEIANSLTMTVDFSAAANNTNIDINEFEVYLAR